MSHPARPGRFGRSFNFSRLRTAATPELDLRYLGRMVLHALLVGAVAGTAGSLFFMALEVAQHWVLEGLAGYEPLRAQGEHIAEGTVRGPFRPWLLMLLPGIGALAGGLLTFYVAPEAQGGGGDATLHAFHYQGGVIRRRVPWVKAVASILTLGSGGSGGREGPTMQIGGAIGSLVARYLRVTPRERRILLVAGVGAGMAAVFRTPLGAALLAVEILYRDDFESDALIPALLASVVSYSVFISFQGESTLFAHAPRYPFIPAHLAWFALLAVLIALVSGGFLTVLRAVQRGSAKLPVPGWLRPGLGGLALGICATPVVMFIGPKIGEAGQGIGIFSGGYGAAQVAIVGAPWLPSGWSGVELLLLAGFVKIIATSFTVGSGGSAGDFGPSLVMGGLFGGAFGRALLLLTHDPRIDPGAFALVGMGTFYGGIAHVPVGSLVMVCELAGSYDLLVPLMLAEGVAFVALRHRSLYNAQIPSKRDSPAHRQDVLQQALGHLDVTQIPMRDRPYVSFVLNSPTSEVVRKIAEASWQDIFPVLGPNGQLAGMINSDILRLYVAEREFESVSIAADLMQSPLTVKLTDKLHDAMEVMLANHLRELPVIGDGGQIIGFLDEADITEAYLAAFRPDHG